jgi:2-polyprenyl-3-methyl-5-hydroxy-6-metoxy-1,4-benzoquinol methylase
MAENTSSQTGNGVVRVAPGGTPFANILWRWLGVRAVPHLPCRFDCAATIEFAECLLALARNNGYSQEAEWIEEILTWPVEWSALHGIAEIKSPLMKLSTRTDATAGKWVVQWAGTDYPKEGAVGLHFPFRPPKKSRISLLEISTTDLRAPVSNDSGEAWRYADNGFTSFTTMEELHQPLLTMAREALAGKSGNVLDLGCGNGILLNKICSGRPDLTPHGIDSNGLALDHARQLQPELPAKFLQGDLFEIESWASGNQRYTLAILMLGRLVEVPTESALRLLNQLQVSCEQVLVYVYPDWGEQRLGGIAARFGLALEPSSYQSAAFLK